MVTHTLVDRPGTEIVWDPAHRAAVEAIALARAAHATGTSTSCHPQPMATEQLDLGDGDYDVDAPDLDARYGVGEELA